MTLKSGTRLTLPGSTCEVMVVRPPSTDGELSAPEGQDGQEPILVGKRYADEESGLEVLCVKAGAGPLRFAGRALVLRAAKPLPASD
ncbi:hypothetical protein [Mycobacterium sp. UM_Kg1]|uniref:hypothetical protein n=1 Tax=Mycobacterium sp. UM_Kg1 TaxID=1545691 RepID=UPI00061AA023|nr:hypothetical protein [Mycobacterium sp. UM_Kg1]